jgi:hypothetical protein
MITFNNTNINPACTTLEPHGTYRPTVVRQCEKDPTHKRHIWFLPTHEPKLKKPKEPFLPTHGLNDGI